jgi:hypothetical protein
MSFVSGFGLRSVLIVSLVLGKFVAKISDRNTEFGR